MHYLFLTAAIVTEVIGTASLQASQQFTRALPTLAVLVGYSLSFYFLGLTLRTMTLGPVYAIWSGLGIVLIAGAGWLLFDQRPDGPAILGMTLIVAGVIVINVFSRSVNH